MSTDLEQELRDFVSRMRRNKRGTRLCRQAWHVDVEPPFEDFNREVVPPGATKAFPKGAVGIRVDDDYWTVAVLPHRFVGLDCRTIVSVLWPSVADPVINPDSGDYWWTARFDPDLEVPGAPFEIWTHDTNPKGRTESDRRGFYPSREAALADEASWRFHSADGWDVRVELREWRDGVRLEGERRAPTNHLRGDPEGPVSNAIYV